MPASADSEGWGSSAKLAIADVHYPGNTVNASMTIIWKTEHVFYQARVEQPSWLYLLSSRSKSAARGLVGEELPQRETLSLEAGPISGRRRLNDGLRSKELDLSLWQSVESLAVLSVQTD
jgi:hypothetical protein